MKRYMFDKIVTSITLILLVHSPSLLAHHAFSATFIKDKKIQVVGVVTKYNFRNPHVMVHFDVTNEDGSVTGWVSEGNSATILRRAGWSAQTFTEGDLIRVSGDSTHDGSPMTSIDVVEILDSSTLEVVEVMTPDNSRELYKPPVADYVPMELPDGRPNLNGVWTIKYRGIGPPPVPSVPLNSLGIANQTALANDPQIFCDPPGLARQVMSHHPVRFTLNEDHVLLEYEEYAGRRIVYFDDRNSKGVKTHLGDSIARYEDNKLIIESTNLLSNLTNREGGRLSDQVTITETYHRVDQDEGRTALNVHINISDPLYLSENLIEEHVLLDAGNTYEMPENDCHPPLRERTEVSPVTSFFVTSTGLGDGANLGGIDGADAHCEALASNIGQGRKNWKAYLSTTGDNPIHARNRIGDGPWYNSRGVLVAQDVEQLHGENMIDGSTAITELAKEVHGRGQGDDWRSWHDILTGTQSNGFALISEEDTTCENWMSNSEGSAIVGHHNREGGGDDPTSWVSAHRSRGCSQEHLESSGGAGLFYCFATDK